MADIPFRIIAISCTATASTRTLKKPPPFNTAQPRVATLRTTVRAIAAFGACVREETREMLVGNKPSSDQAKKVRTAIVMFGIINSGYAAAKVIRSHQASSVLPPAIEVRNV